MLRIAFAIPWPVEHTLAALQRTTARAPAIVRSVKGLGNYYQEEIPGVQLYSPLALLRHGLKVFTQGAGTTLVELVTGVGQCTECCARWTTALGSGYILPFGTHWRGTQLHGLGTGITQCEDLKAFLERCPVEQLPATGHAGTWILGRITPGWRHNASPHRRLLLCEQQEEEQ